MASPHSVSAAKNKHPDLKIGNSFRSHLREFSALMAIKNPYLIVLNLRWRSLKAIRPWPRLIHWNLAKLIVFCLNADRFRNISRE